MFRLLFLTFFGVERFDEHHVHVHESPRSMLAPLVDRRSSPWPAAGCKALRNSGAALNCFNHFLAPVLESGRGASAAAEQFQGFWTTLYLPRLSPGRQ